MMIHLVAISNIVYIAITVIACEALVLSVIRNIRRAING